MVKSVPLSLSSTLTCVETNVLVKATSSAATTGTKLGWEEGSWVRGRDGTEVASATDGVALGVMLGREEGTPIGSRADGPREPVGVGPLLGAGVDSTRLGNDDGSLMGIIVGPLEPVGVGPLVGVELGNEMNGGILDADDGLSLGVLVGPREPTGADSLLGDELGADDDEDEVGRNDWSPPGISVGVLEPVGVGPAGAAEVGPLEEELGTEGDGEEVIVDDGREEGWTAFVTAMVTVALSLVPKMF
jgi:hypothetical protein